MGRSDRVVAPAGAWQACANGKLDLPEGSKIWVAVHIGGARADTAVVWLDEDFGVGCRTWSGDEALMDASPATGARGS